MLFSKKKMQFFRSLFDLGYFGFSLIWFSLFFLPTPKFIMLFAFSSFITHLEFHTTRYKKILVLCFTICVVNLSTNLFYSERLNLYLILFVPGARGLVVKSSRLWISPPKFESWPLLIKVGWKRRFSWMLSTGSPVQLRWTVIRR